MWQLMRKEVILVFLLPLFFSSKYVALLDPFYVDG